GELAPVVEAQRAGLAVELDQLVEQADRALAGDREADEDAERLAVAVVENVERSETPAVVECVVYEVERPDPVELGRRLERKRIPARDPALGPPRQIEPQGAVDAMNALVVPSVPLDAKPVVALPKAPARALLHHRIERLDHARISLRARPWDSIERRPGKSHD